MATIDMNFSQTNQTLAFPVIQPEVKRLAPVAKPEASARNFADQQEGQQAGGKADQKVVQETSPTKLQQMLQQMGGRNSELAISIDKGSGKLIVKILNSETREIIKQIPPDEVVKMAESLREMSGGLVNEVA